ncbi:crossover junction endonuclease EME1 [Vombatus ursinus]|uniref:Structure-specific endonuclease subunit EME1 n=1 Tax=Vombatus ursinus TaxID=29139 RepID=A0A4X2LRP5_VOMUR|nr:crossover junction endonuclease EME1 [Vombatus ursinus]XP_027726357.1 crossover junction endonuclease EME1 [Vombatus ursinus]XP_027726358.1 crossover junction endonuclease EME1 [Vombatus ursinus]XP_027726359.1 crossover junction endonuclease EME1 [Vombatus ursinus]XP_027726360.1 crossover junction endonuclease EME1 [Vombatus ursinus]
MMGPKKLPLDTSESDSEELPTFTFLKQKPSLTKSGQVVVHSSDAECSSSSPVALQEAARTVSPEEPVTVLSSESEEGEELIPLVQRLQCRTTYSFSKAQESSHQDSSSQTKCALSHQHNEGTAEEWKEQPFPKTLVLSNSSSVKEVSKNDGDVVEEEPHNYLPAYSSVFPVQIRNVSATEKSSVLSPSPKRTKYAQKERGKGWQGPLQTQRKQKESEQRQQERERKKALANMLKAQKPEACLKHITVVLDPALLQLDGGGQILSALQAMECHCAIEAQTIPCSITWKRRASLSQAEEGNLMEEPFLLVLLREKEFMTMIYNSKQDGPEGKETLQSFVTWVTTKTLGKTLSLAVMEQEKYFSSPKPQRRKKQGVTVNRDQAKGKVNQKGSKENREFAPVLSRVDVEMALVELQLHTEAQIRILKSWKELADFICMFTKAVAEAPFKRSRDQTNFSFCLASDWAGGVKVDCSGKGLTLVWRRQIQQLNRVSLEIASAIVSAYPSPRLLLQAYQQCLSEQECHNLLADIQVRRGEGVTTTSRRVGPELSRRIYFQMTTLQPDLSLDGT